jgi:hypothetical protein
MLSNENNATSPLKLNNEIWLAQRRRFPNCLTIVGQLDLFGIM